MLTKQVVPNRGARGNKRRISSVLLKLSQLSGLLVLIAGVFFLNFLKALLPPGFGSCSVEINACMDEAHCWSY